MRKRLSHFTAAAVPTASSKQETLLKDGDLYRVVLTGCWLAATGFLPFVSLTVLS